MKRDSMSPPQVDAYKAQADLLKALAHPTRLQILDILATEESCVCHMTTILDQRQPYVSQQLMKLRDAELVLDRREGVMMYYRLADPAMVEVIARMRRALGEDALPEMPRSPVPGCPCPHCSQDVDG